MSTSDSDLARDLARHRTAINAAAGEIGAIVRQLGERVAAHRPLAPALEKQLLRMMQAEQSRPEAFEVLAKTNLDAAENALRQSVLDPIFKPDRRSSGYQSQLELMMASLAEVGGVERLASFLAALPMPDDRVIDHDVICALQFVLDVEYDEAEAWLRRVRSGSSVASPPTPPDGATSREQERTAVDRVDRQAADERLVADDEAIARILALRWDEILSEEKSLRTKLRPLYQNPIGVRLPAGVEDELEALIRFGEVRTLAFDILARANLDRACVVLREVMFDLPTDSWYLPGGYGADLGRMLPVLVRLGGRERFERFVRGLDLDSDRLEDPRFVCAVAEALDLNYEEAAAWILRVRLR